jgi:hypothetical protein
MSSRYRLFSWEHSYFSGKVRAYLRYKHYFGDLGDGYEDILATPELIQGLLVPATGSNVVPQILTPDGAWLLGALVLLPRRVDTESIGFQCAAMGRIHQPAWHG